MKYFDRKTNSFKATQDATNSLEAYDNDFFDDLYQRARNGEMIDISDIETPSFIDRELLQTSLLTAVYYYLKAHNGDSDEIQRLEALLFTTEQAEGREGNEE